MEPDAAEPDDALAVPPGSWRRPSATATTWCGCRGRRGGVDTQGRRCLAFDEVDVNVWAADHAHDQQHEGGDRQLGPQRHSSVHRTVPFVEWLSRAGWFLRTAGLDCAKKRAIRTFCTIFRSTPPASGGGVASGMATVNVVPLPSAVLTDAWPPWASAIDATMASPSPAPPHRPGACLVHPVEAVERHGGLLVGHTRPRVGYLEHPDAVPAVGTNRHRRAGRRMTPHVRHQVGGHLAQARLVAHDDDRLPGVEVDGPCRVDHS